MSLWSYESGYCFLQQTIDKDDENGSCDDENIRLFFAFGFDAEINDIIEDIFEGLRIVKDEVHANENDKFNENDKQDDEVGVQLHSLFLVETHSQILPVYIIRLHCGHNLQNVAIVYESFGVSLVLIQEKIAIMLILERYEGMSYEMGEIK